MCLGMPGKVVEVDVDTRDGDMPMGRVEIGGECRDVCLAYVPAVAVGDYVLVHVGFAMSVVDESEVHRTVEMLCGLGASEPAEERSTW